MKIAKVIKNAVPATLLAAAGVVFAANPTMDGVRDASYGTTALTSQKASVIDITLATLNAAAQSNQSNVGGVVTFAGSTFTFPPVDSDPSLVTTGVEIAVDLAELGHDGQAIKISGWLSKDGQGTIISNQVIGGLDPNSQNLGNGPTTNLSTVNGTQEVTVPNTPSGTAAIVDGTRDAAYGAPLLVNQLATTLGNTSIGSQNNANGSEIDAVYAYRTATRLYIFVAGNLRTQFDKLFLWIDAKSGGQSTILTGNAGVDFGIINSYAGLAFETGFAADYFIDYTGGPSGDHYLNYATLPDAAGGGGGYTRGDKNIPVGEFRILSFPGQPTTNGQSAPPNGGSMEAASNNSNLGGVAGAISQPNPWTVPPGSNPGSVNTGAEIKIPLAETGWVAGTTSIRVGGFILGFNWDFLSNQVIGSVPATQDNYGFPANGVDFSSVLNAGNQFVTATVPGSLVNRSIALDGTRDAGQGYALIWTNNSPANSGNPTGFGDSSLASVDRSNGSEIDNVFVSFGLDPSNGGAPTMWIFAGGNIHDNNKLAFFLDTKTGGQNQFVAGNPAFGLEKLGPDGNGPGLKWDAGFEPDYMVAYAANFDTGTNAASHTVYAAQLPTAGGGYGGVAASGTKSGTATPLSGTFRARTGFGNNTDATIYNANGNELDNAFAQLGTSPVDGSPTIYFHLGGNLEPVSNKIDMFFDVIPGVGQNTLIFDDPADGYTGNPDVDFFALNRMGGPVAVGTPPVVQPGMTFDAGFTADYFFSVTTNNANTSTQTADIFANWARLKDVPTVGDPGAKRYIGKTTTGGLGFFDGGDFGTNEPTVVAIDNSNTGGVAGGANAFVTPTSDPATVTKGIEIGIPLADLAPWDGTTGTIKVTAFINGQNHDFVSNQVLQTYCGNDLGEPRLVNFNTIPGVQFMTLNYNAGNQRYTNTSAQTPSCTPACTGDFNNDGQRNTQDLTLLLSNFGQNGANLLGDINGDNTVNTQDLVSFLSVFGQPC